MKRSAILASLFGFACCGAVQAAVIDLGNHRAAAPISAPISAAIDDLSVSASEAIVVPPSAMSELPEPEVFAMMLVGLLLIGYRASRHSSEKFR